MTLLPRIIDVAAYLTAKGWAVSGHWRNANVWSRGDFDVLVPPADSVADAARRLHELVRCVADAEGRPAEAIWRDMISPAVDVLSYRTQETFDNLTLKAGAETLEAIRDLIVNSAREALGDNRSSLQGRHPEAVRRLLERSLMSWSEDTFGLDVRIPFDDNSKPLGRTTALRILHSSTTVLHAVQSLDAKGFERVLQGGISEAVCVALVGLAGPDRKAPFELGFRWSQLAPRDDVVVRFPHGAGIRILQGSRSAELPVASGSGVVEGFVTSLSDDESGDRWRIRIRGLLTIDAGDVEERQQVVTVRLGAAADYTAALDAHRYGHMVRAEGALTRSRRAAEIVSAPQGFTLIDDTHPRM
ncbi:hypothetical protein [Nocardia sp. N2S4-5]|uniref:hypothetical protein n=1 Tax=Nocardia sp. N2S4-5 TaxID=3351565 RepID=UPI0037D7CF17